MLAPILFGPGPSGTSNTASSGPSSAGSTSSSGTPSSPTAEPSYSEPDATDPSDIDDGTYQPTTGEEPEGTDADTTTGSEPPTEGTVAADAGSDTVPAPAEDNAGSEDIVASDAPPEELGSEPAAPVPPAEESTETPALTENTSSGATSPPSNDRPAAPVAAERNLSTDKAAEAAALASYRGERVDAQSDNNAFRERITALVDQSLSRSRDRALEVSQARIIAGLLSGAEEPQTSASDDLSLEPQRRPVAVAEAIRAYRQA